jgi:hypothetical protein
VDQQHLLQPSPCIVALNEPQLPHDAAAALPCAVQPPSSRTSGLLHLKHYADQKHTVKHCVHTCDTAGALLAKQKRDVEAASVDSARDS